MISAHTDVMDFADGLAFDHDLPMVWETPDSLRIGVEHPMARISDITAAEQRFVSALRRGIASGRLAEVAKKCGLTPAGRDDLLTRAHAALGPTSPLPRLSPSPATRAWIVTGENWASMQWTGVLTAALRATGVLVSQVTADSPTEVSLLGNPAGSGTESGGADVLILPERYAASHTEVTPWLAHGIPALSIRLRDRAVVIGPMLGLSNSPCLDCCNHAEIERDRVWPIITAQLFGLRPPSETPTVALAVAAHTAAFLAGPGPPGRQVRLPVRLGLPEPGAETLLVPQRADCACAGMVSTSLQAAATLSG
jgi:hypothetical protein